MKFKKWLENTVPKILYHHSVPENRQSILQNGLQTKFDKTGDENSIKGIYLTDKPFYTKDTWKVNVNDLPVEEDVDFHDAEEYGNWYTVYQDIPPNRIRLIYF